MGFTRTPNGELAPPRLDKTTYRQLHRTQRRDRSESERLFVDTYASKLIKHFANGDEIDIERISVRLIPISHSTAESDLFRLATLLWSVPVSMGFGRRLRFLVWDSHADRLLGLLALGDPVFNLHARDSFVGWTGRDRETRLVNLLDGYVVGAVLPYNQILGGKLVACLMRTREIVDTFRLRYGSSEGIISGKEKNAHLVAVTTTSALGRSSVYNRLRINGVKYLDSIGYTGGYGHFHFPNALFEELRGYLRQRKDAYAENNRYGQGPNWKMRMIRQGLVRLGMNPNLIKHGLEREVFLSCLADNALEVLRGKRKRPKYDTLQSVTEVSELALNRWVRPRALRDNSYVGVTRDRLLERLRGAEALPPSEPRRKRHV
jgi:hypothetical protein